MLKSAIYLNVVILFVASIIFLKKISKNDTDLKSLKKLIISYLLLDIIDIYKEISEFKIIFTKLDETSTYGNLLNVKLYSDAELSYITNGQNVPDDIEIFDTQKIVKNLLGGK